jgi:hypothetical protein
MIARTPVAGAGASAVPATNMPHPAATINTLFSLCMQFSRC